VIFAQQQQQQQQMSLGSRLPSGSTTCFNSYPNIAGKNYTHLQVNLLAENLFRKI